MIMIIKKYISPPFLNLFVPFKKLQSGILHTFIVAIITSLELISQIVDIINLFQVSDERQSFGSLQSMTALLLIPFPDVIIVKSACDCDH